VNKRVRRQLSIAVVALLLLPPSVLADDEGGLTPVADWPGKEATEKREADQICIDTKTKEKVLCADVGCKLFVNVKPPLAVGATANEFIGPLKLRPGEQMCTTATGVVRAVVEEGKLLLCDSSVGRVYNWKLPQDSAATAFPCCKEQKCGAVLANGDRQLVGCTATESHVVDIEQPDTWKIACNSGHCFVSQVIGPADQLVCKKYSAPAAPPTLQYLSTKP
jgi:hypothetical protein